MTQHFAEHAQVADASVREARTSDATAVGMIQSAAWRQAYAAVLEPAVLDALEPRAFARVWRDSLAAPPSADHRLLVACAGQQVVGFLAVGPSTDPDAAEDEAELLTLAVHPGARRMGHGSRLLNAATDTLVATGRRAVSTWVLAHDEEARGFLQRAGFGPDGAFRDRVVGDPEAPIRVAREVRLTATIG